MSVSKLGFVKMDLLEFQDWISKMSVSRTIFYIQQHHTWNPSYISFNGKNHFEIQQGMKSFHIANNGWMDIGQHFTTFPDGSILTGRSLEQNPACILGFNSHSICIENLGNFDKNKDKMTPEQHASIIGITAAISKRFSISINTDKIVYHHWFDLSTGERNNGSKNNKTCPGTDFFNGNSLLACEQNFLPLVNALISSQPKVANVPAILLFALVTVSSLNARISASSKSKLVGPPAIQGSILRVYESINGWYKISFTQQKWVKASFTKPVELFRVNVNVLNVRNGPGPEYDKVSCLLKGQEIFVLAEQNGWCNIQTDSQWVKKSHLSKT